MHSWFALQVRTRAEAQVESLLREKAFETFLPSYLDCRRYSDRIRRVQAALFPGYLFCRFDPARRLPLLVTPGVREIVSCGGQPLPVAESEIEPLRRLSGAGADLRPWPWLAPGDRVRIECGAFSGVEGQLVTARDTDYLVLSVSLLQRSASVEVERSWVRPVDEFGGLRRALA